MKYRPEIDGLRALAVLPVMFFHAGFAGFDGGFVGVDVFFVISGYLITGILVEEHDRGSFTLIGFYERRARRILPALFFVMLASLPFAWLWLPDSQLVEFAQSLVATSTFSSNIYFWIQSDYFDTAAEFKPLLHTWSLAVEEQYYIFFPLLLMLFWHRGLKLMLVLLVLAFVSSLVLAEWASVHKPSSAFYLLPTRGWELLVGVFAALYLKYRPHFASAAINSTLSGLGMTLIVFSVVYFDKSTPFPGIYALVPTLGTALLILAAVPGTLSYKLLSGRAVVGVGLISYSAYLWHQPLFAFARHRTLGDVSDGLLLILCGLSLALAYASWRWVERPFRDKSVTSQRQIFTFSLVGLLSFAAIGAVLSGLLLHSDRLASRLTPHDRYQSWAHSIGATQYQINNISLREASWEPLRSLSGNPAYEVQGNVHDQTLWFDESDPRPKLLVVGNSHSKDLYNLLSHSPAVTERFELARFGAQVENLGPAFYASPNYLNADVVIICSLYSDADLTALPAQLERISTDGKKILLTHEVFAFTEGDGELYTLADIQVARSYAGTAEGVMPSSLVSQINSAYSRQYEQRDSISKYSYKMAVIDQLAAERDHVSTLDRMDSVCPNGLNCAGVGPRLEKYWYDYEHMTLAGAIHFASELHTTAFFRQLVSAVGLDDHE